MKYSNRYKFVATVSLSFILALSLMFMFLVGKNQTIGIKDAKDSFGPNVAYIVIKCIALAYLGLAIALIWKKDATFAKYFPLTITAVLYQGIPALARIGYANTGKVGVWVYFMVVILTFFLVGAASLYLVSNDQFRENEQKAKHSSNYYKK